MTKHSHAAFTGHVLQLCVYVRACVTELRTISSLIYSNKIQSFIHAEVPEGHLNCGQ